MAEHDGFIWGTASSSLQCEGAAPSADWSRWERDGRAPPSRDGNGFADRAEEDLLLLGQLGIHAHRIVLEWARLEPRDGHRDRGVAQHYREVLQAARAAGVSPWVCLHHTSLPGWFVDDRRGFRDEDDGRYRWSTHVDWVAETFGDLVEGWVPVHAPHAYAVAGYLAGAHPPGRTSDDDAATVLRTLHRAAADAARLLHGPAPVATSHDLAPVRGTVTDDVGWMWASWDEPALLDPFDLVGAAIAPSDTPTADALAEVLHRLVEVVQGRPILVTALGVGGDDDAARADLVRDSAGVVRDAIADGINVRGLFHWTAIDGYEGLAGHQPWGIVDRDRNVKPSGSALSKLATSG